MHHRNDQTSVDPARLTVDAGDFLSWKPARHREAPKRHNHQRIQRGDLPFEKLTARSNFVRLGIAIVRRAVFDDVGNEYITPAQPGKREQLFEELPGSSYKWATLAIFIETRRLANEHHFRIRRTFARNGPHCRLMQSARGACANVVGNLLE
jgi:hypothetical protein